MARPTRARELDKLALFTDLGYEPHPAQAEVHQSSAQIRVLVTGARFGKTTAAAFEVIAALLSPATRTLGWVAAPTYTLTEHVFNEVMGVFEDAMPHRIRSFVARTRTLTVVNLLGGTSVLTAKSCDNPASLLGAALDFLVLDEAAQVDRRVWEEALSPRLLDRRGWALLISTPKGCNWLYTAFKRGQRKVAGYESWRFPSSANPHLDAAQIEAQRPLMSVDAFAEQYLAEFRGEHLDACDTCGGPSPTACGYILAKSGRELPTCSECRRLVDDQGRTIVPSRADGSAASAAVFLFPDDGGKSPFVREPMEAYITDAMVEASRLVAVGAAAEVGP